MPFELLTKSLTEAGIAPEAVTQLVANEKAAQTMQTWLESGLRQSDYDRKMNTGKAEIAASQRTLQEERDAFEKHKKAINDQFLSAQTEREKAESQLGTVRAKIKTASQVYGVDLEKELFGDAPPPNPNPPKPPESVIPDDFRRRVDEVANMVPLTLELQAEMLDISRQHADLFPDKPLLFKELLEEATKQRRSPTQVWDDKFGATAKRQELRDKKISDEAYERAKQELEKKYSGQIVNGLRTTLPTSPMFNLSKEPLKPGDRNARSSEAVQRAVEALASGKYRQPHMAGVER